MQCKTWTRIESQSDSKNLRQTKAIKLTFSEYKWYMKLTKITFR